MLNLTREQAIEIVQNVLEITRAEYLMHGSRCAYLMNEFALRAGMNKKNAQMMTVIALIHDLGAYKTEDFNNIKKFDAVDSYRHAVYGAMYAKYFFGASAAAKIILHHHDYYNSHSRSKTLRLGVLMHLIDRLDVMQLGGMSNAEIKGKIMENSGKMFAPSDVVIAYSMIDDGVLDFLRNGAEAPFIKDYLQSIKVTKTFWASSISSLTGIFDLYNEDTFAHTRTCAVFAEEIARSIKMKRNEIDELTLAARMHDLGKVGVPGEILCKPDSLTDEEKEVMRTHVVITEAVLSGVLPPKVVDIAARHHERLDGSGYPRGLKAKDLTTADRVLQIADVISALHGKRAYKSALGLNEVLSVLRDEVDAGRLDGEIVMSYAKNSIDISTMYTRELNKVHAFFDRIDREAKQIIALRTLSTVKRDNSGGAPTKRR